MPRKMEIPTSESPGHGFFGPRKFEGTQATPLSTGSSWHQGLGKPCALQGLIGRPINLSRNPASSLSRRSGTCKAGRQAGGPAINSSEAVRPAGLRWSWAPIVAMAVVLTEIMGSETHPSSYEMTSSMPLVGHHSALLSVCLFELPAKVLILGGGFLLHGEDPLPMDPRQGPDLLGRPGALPGHELRLVGLG